MRTCFRNFLLAAGCLEIATALFSNPGRADDRQRAWDLVQSELGRNVVKLGDSSLVVAGGHQFHDLWVRDFAMSVGGLLAINREDAVRDTLDLIFSLERDDGLLPRVIDNQNITARTILGSSLGWVQDFSQPLKGWFETENQVLVIDGNAAVPWAASRYLAATHDIAAARRWMPAIEKALAFLDRDYLVGGLIGNQPPFSDWEDSVGRRGRVAFTNELFLLALDGMAGVAELAGQRDRAQEFRERALQFHAAFLDFFMDPVHQRLLNFEGDDHWTADANFIAIAKHLVSFEQGHDLLAGWPEQARGVLPRTTWPDYGDAMKDRIVKWVGIADYHDALSWLWIGALAALAQREAGDCGAYWQQMDAMTDLILKKGAVYEIYEPILLESGLRPVDRTFYRAEQPFTWSSALYLEAAAAGCGTSSKVGAADFNFKPWFQASD